MSMRIKTDFKIIIFLQNKDTAIKVCVRVFSL